MNKLIGLLLLALAFLAPSNAEAASRFWVGGTGTWDAADTTHWAASSGGAGGASVPGTGDTVTFDASSGGGTVTPNTTITVQSIAAGAFTGTLAFNTNNNNVTVSASGQSVIFGGTGTRTINMGSGTWTLSGGGTWECPTVTNLTATFSNAPIVMSGATASRTFAGGGLTYNSLTISSNSTKGPTGFLQGNTFASITVAEGNTLQLPQGTTTTISGALTMTGSSSLPVGIVSNSPVTNVTTISVGSASTVDWGGIYAVTKSGAGSITATNSLDMGRNTSITITGPSAGGGGGRIIGG